MTERAKQLHATADRQIAELVGLISTLSEAVLRLPCPGREKLGDGTVAASVRHTADNYQRIATFVTTSDRMSAAHAPAQHGRHRIPRFLLGLGHGSSDHGEHGAGAGHYDDRYAAEKVDVGAVLAQLSTTRDALDQIAELDDRQLDAIPPKDSFRFCDGQRTLEQVLANVLKHQDHQLDALKAATTQQPDAACAAYHPRRTRSQPKRG